MEKYTSAKQKNQAMQEFIHDFVSEKTHKRVCECGNWLNFIADWKVVKCKLYAANFCKWPFCPMCSWRRAIRDSLKISILMAYIHDTFGYEFIFLTLTAPNVKGDKLSAEIEKYNRAFRRLILRKEVKAMCLGFIRKLEITHNEKRDDYHPHFHVVIAVKRDYFKSKQYIKQERWLELWRECMRDDSITQVDVRKVQRRADADTLAESFDASEFAKYAAKDADYTKSKKVFKVFYDALYRKQKLTYGGVFAEAQKKFKAGELDEYKKTDKTVYYWEIMYAWKGKQYEESKKRKLNELDKEILARRGIDTELLDEE